MPKTSAGILLYRIKSAEPEVFLVHPGGPLWARKDKGAWSIPKGEFTNERPLEAALREFKEETGQELHGDFRSLTPIRLKSGKIIFAFAIQDDLDEKSLESNLFTMEWPPKSGKITAFPEIDKGAWFDFQTAREKLNPAQTAFIQELADFLKK